MMTDLSEWMLRGHAKATIAFNDPVWMVQSYEMDRGERERNDYDPPIPDHFVDVLRGRQRRVNELRDLMLAQRCYDVPTDAERDAWAPLVEKFDFEGRELFQGPLAWVPEILVAEYRVLSTASLPCSADLSKAATC